MSAGQVNLVLGMLEFTMERTPLRPLHQVKEGGLLVWLKRRFGAWS